MKKAPAFRPELLFQFKMIFIFHLFDFLKTIIVFSEIPE